MSKICSLFTLKTLSKCLSFQCGSLSMSYRRDRNGVLVHHNPCFLFGYSLWDSFVTQSNIWPIELHWYLHHLSFIFEVSGGDQIQVYLRGGNRFKSCIWHWVHQTWWIDCVWRACDDLFAKVESCKMVEQDVIFMRKCRTQLNHARPLRPQRPLYRCPVGSGLYNMTKTVNKA